MAVPPPDWSTHQLTQFLSAISTRAESQERAIAVGVERAAEALEAEVGAYVYEGTVVSSVGFPVDQVPIEALIAAADAGGGTIELPDLGLCQTTVVRGEATLPGKLVLARSGDDAFTRDEINLVAGMMRLLQLNDRMLGVVDRERASRDEAERQADLNAGLLTSLEERHRLLERLSRLQRSISHRDPLPDVLHAVTAGASELFGTEVDVALRLFDPGELVLLPLGRPGAEPSDAPKRSVDRVAGWRAIANETLVMVDEDMQGAGAVVAEGDVRTAMAAPVYQEGKVVGSLVVASRSRGRRYNESEQEALLAFAEHASLALTDAATIDALRRQTGLLALLESVAASANEAAGVEEAVQTCLDNVCAYTSWPIAYAYFRGETPPGGPAGAPVPSGCSHLDEPFASRCPGLEGVGTKLASWVLSAGKPVWMPNVAELEGSPSDDPGPRVTSAFAFPVLAGREVVAALEFFSVSGAEPDVELRESLAQVGTQLGRVVERTRAAAAVQETSERTRRIIEAAKDAFVSVDGNDTITDFNQAAEQTFGWTREEAVGRRVLDLIIAPAHRLAYRDGLARYLSRSGEPASVVLELTATHRDGHEFPIECAVWPVRSGKGWEFNAFARDISDRKRAQQELADARDASLEASRLKSAFLATMSHEIRTPMNGILGMTTLLLDTTLDADQRECAEAVERSAQALLTIINDILDISKIEAGRLELESMDFDLAALVGSVTELLASQAAAKGLQLTTTIGAAVPAAVRGDPGRLRQVLTNLVGNAVKFTDSGSVAVRVQTEAGDGGVGVHFEVADTGIGIPKSAQTSIFEAFRQADATTTRRFGGTGLGLAITQQLVGMMGGEIHVDSTPGVGSTFSFTLHLAKASGVPAPPSPEEVPARLTPGARVLVAEDNPVNQRILVKTLERVGYTVDVRSTGLAAVDAATASTYDIVLMDCQMPEMDGYEATRMVRLVEGDRRHTPIIAITASAMTSDRERCLAAGMDDFIAKPIDPAELMAALAKWVRPRQPLSAVPPPAPPAAPPSAPTSGDAAVDTQVLRDLSARLGPGSEGILRDLVDAFVDDGPVSLNGIHTALAAADAEAFARAAHRLRGSAASFGAETLARLCTRAEELGWAGDVAAAAPLVPLITEELARVERALRSELAEAI